MLTVVHICPLLIQEQSLLTVFQRQRVFINIHKDLNLLKKTDPNARKQNNFHNKLSKYFCRLFSTSMLFTTLCHNEEEKWGWEILNRYILKTKKNDPPNPAPLPPCQKKPNNKPKKPTTTTKKTKPKQTLTLLSKVA